MSIKKLNNSNYSHNNRCKCGELICNHSTMCSKCSRKQHSIFMTGRKQSPCTEEHKRKIGLANSGKKNGSFKHGLYSKTYENICACGNKIARPEAKCCGECHLKQVKGRPRFDFRGTNHPNYNGGDIKDLCVCGRQKHQSSQFCNHCAKLGNRNPMYGGGNSREPYSLDFSPTLKAKIRKRDNYTCQISGEKFVKSSRYLQVHHIDYDKNNNDPSNLICLSAKWNIRANFNRGYWQEYFKNLHFYKIYGKLKKQELFFQIGGNK